MDQHRIYLLHLWTEEQENEDGKASLQAALEEPHTGRRWGFTDMTSLVKFVEEVLVRDPEEEGF